MTKCYLCVPLEWADTSNTLNREYQRGKYHCTNDLLFDWFGISCKTTDNFCFYLQNRLIQTIQTGGEQYSDTPPLVFPALKHARAKLPTLLAQLSFVIFAVGQTVAASKILGVGC